MAMLSGAVGGQAGGMLASSGLSGQASAAVGGLMGSMGLGFLNGLIGRSDPDVPYQFMLEMTGLIQNVAFKEASGLKMTTKVKKIREGGNNLYERSLIEANTFDPLIIKKGWYASKTEFYDWMMHVHNPSKSAKYKRINIDLVAFNNKFSELCRFTLFNCFITEYEGPKFDAHSKEIGFETIKINYDYFTFKPSSGLAKLGQDLLSSGMAAVGNAI